MAGILFALLVVGAVAAAFPAGLRDARNRSWRKAAHGLAFFAIATAAVIAWAFVGSGSIWYTVIIAPMAAAFFLVYLIIRLITVLPFRPQTDA